MVDDPVDSKHAEFWIELKDPANEDESTVKYGVGLALKEDTDVEAIEQYISEHKLGGEGMEECRQYMHSVVDKLFDAAEPRGECTSFHRGHKMMLIDGVWCYCDTGEPVHEQPDRPCGFGVPRFGCWRHRGGILAYADRRPSRGCCNPFIRLHKRGRNSL